MEEESPLLAWLQNLPYGMWDYIPGGRSGELGDRLQKLMSAFYDLEVDIEDERTKFASYRATS